MVIQIVKQDYLRSAGHSSSRKLSVLVAVVLVIGYLFSYKQTSIYSSEIDHAQSNLELSSVDSVDEQTESKAASAIKWYNKQIAELSSAVGRLGMSKSCTKTAQAIRPAETAVVVTPARPRPSPFDQFQCLGEDLDPKGARTTGIYAKPFRFHVYRDMPAKLLKHPYENATHWFSQHDSARSQFLTERQIYEYLHLHPCHTSDESEADAFIVPAQTISAVWLSRVLDADGNDGEWRDEGAGYRQEVMEWLEKEKPAYSRFGGHDHYAVFVPWWVRGRTYPGHMSAIGVECPTAFENQRHFSDTQYAASASDITIPYPDPDAQAYYSDERLATIDRNLLAVFVGQMPQNGPVRKVIYRQFSEYNTRSGKELAVWSNLNVRDDIRSVKNLLARGTFGPVMPGDSYSSRRLFSLIFAGTIPVIICDHCLLPYQSMINYRKFAIFVSEERLMRGDGYDLFNDVLSKVSDAQIESYQHYGRLVRRHFTYAAGPPVPGDAFDLMIREMALTHYRNRGVKDMMLRASIGRTSHQFMSGDDSLQVPSLDTAKDATLDRDEYDLDSD